MVGHHGSEDNTLGPDDCKAYGPWSNPDFRVPRLRPIGERTLTGPCGGGKKGHLRGPNQGRDYRGVAALARSGPGAARASSMSIIPQAWVQVLRPEAWHPGHHPAHHVAAQTSGFAGRSLDQPAAKQRDARDWLRSDVGVIGRPGGTPGLRHLQGSFRTPSRLLRDRRPARAVQN